MKVNNSNDAKTEKKTKNLGTFVILNQKSVLNYIDEILDRFKEDPGYKEKLLSEMLPERKYKNTKKSQDYLMVSKILKEEMGVQDAGKTTVWRLLKIREESPELYNQIKENKISIRAAYSKLTGEDEKPAKKEKPSDKTSLVKRGKLDFDKLIEELDYIDGELDKIADNESKQPSLKKMKQVDSQLFKMRKKLGSIIADNDPDKFI